MSQSDSSFAAGTTQRNQVGSNCIDWPEEIRVAAAGCLGTGDFDGRPNFGFNRHEYESAGANA